MSSHALTLLDLPDELLLHVALQCDDVVDVSRFARACAALHALITHTDHFWSLMLARHFNVHSDTGVDHRALFRERCARIEWAIPAYARASLGLGDSPSFVYYAVDWLSVSPAAYTKQALHAHGLSAFRVIMSMPGLGYFYHIGIVDFDANDDAEWVACAPPPGRLRAYAHAAGGVGELVHPAADSVQTFTHPVHARGPVFMPAGWRCGRPVASPTDFGWVVGQWVTMVVDADRGRVYYSLGDTGVFLIAFDDERLVHACNLRAYVTLVNEGAWVRIERVRVTDALRLALHAVDDEYVEAQRARK